MRCRGSNGSLFLVDCTDGQLHMIHPCRLIIFMFSDLWGLDRSALCGKTLPGICNPKAADIYLAVHSDVFSASSDP